MADIDLVLEQVRDHYLSAYLAVAREYKIKFDPSSSEVLLEIGGREELPYPYRLYRADLMSGSIDSPNMTEFNRDSYLTLNQFSFLSLESLK